MLDLLFLSCKSSFYILDASPLSDVCFVKKNISQFMIYIFISLNMSFKIPKFLIWKKSILSILFHFYFMRFYSV